jgi:hypothetical protein
VYDLKKIFKSYKNKKKCTNVNINYFNNRHVDFVMKSKERVFFNMLTHVVLFWWGNLREGNHLGNVGEDGRVILK